MNLLGKAAISVAAISMMAAPVAASATTAFDNARATSAVDGQNEFGGKSSWLIGLAGLIAGIIVIGFVVDDNKKNDPVSP
ncbi:hypothetical protein [Sphingopyxis macrogoltabida]|uniref:Uncharacterized protein n=1 Tax=Sphingopyxis macrogoltabida TaxID=33050 RepID=A0A0N9UTK4_SPHMC|nr:hypothetical protein [Sphingopyxis macrogoltabida]ALH80052.1 hypothetical protein AN936_06640 [Sphingopyxis macrogoltabida]